MARNISSRVEDPTWAEVRIEQPATSAKGKPKVVCNHCHRQFSAGITRIKQHFRGDSTAIRACPQCPPQLRERLLAEVSHKQGEASKRTCDEATCSNDQDPVLKAARVYLCDPQERDAARVLLAAAMGARDKATAVKTLAELLKLAPESMEDRDRYSIHCSNCNVEVRVVNWKVIRCLVHQHLPTVILCCPACEYT